MAVETFISQFTMQYNATTRTPSVKLSWANNFPPVGDVERYTMQTSLVCAYTRPSDWISNPIGHMKTAGPVEGVFSEFH